MKHIEVKYSQLLGKVLSFNALAAICTKGTKNRDTLDKDSEKKGKKEFESIGSKKLYGSSLLVDKLLSY